jgi:hypothetical protein
MDEIDKQIKKIKLSRLSPDERFIYNNIKGCKKLKSKKRLIFVKNQKIYFEYIEETNELYYNEYEITKPFKYLVVSIDNNVFEDAIKKVIRTCLNFKEYNSKTILKTRYFWNEKIL